jgi:hypothetical protein
MCRFVTSSTTAGPSAQVYDYVLSNVQIPEDASPVTS